MAEPGPARKRSSLRSRDSSAARFTERPSAPDESFDPSSSSSSSSYFDPATQSNAPSSSVESPPTPESAQPTSPVARTDYSNDAAAGTDRLGIGREVDALAYLIAAREVVPPLSI